MQSSTVAKQDDSELEIGAGIAADFIVRSGALDSPFVLVDIGVRNGIHPRWRPLEPVLHVYGFDAVAQIEPPNERHRYFTMALGERDGECSIDVPHNLYEARVAPHGAVRVAMARLDTLWANGVLPLADFIKIDCEGYEPQVLQGSADYLNAANLLGADIESSFHTSPIVPLSHFAAINKPMVEQRLLVADPAVARADRPDRPWNGTCNILFARHLLHERHHPEHYVYRTSEQQPSLDTILKVIAIFDIYALVGPAAALTLEFRDLIARRIDADALYRKVLLSRRARIEQYLPHLGLGLWSAIKSAGNARAAKRRASTAAS